MSHKQVLFIQVNTLLSQVQLSRDHAKNYAILAISLAWQHCLEIARSISRGSIASRLLNNPLPG